MNGDCLDDALAVLNAATRLNGDLKRATEWFFGERIDLFDGMTAEELV